ncbi:MAG: 2'-5' RNA ligase [Clostridia bacterium]|nr:2'-5' RNA ligase [Clostridia bacterium]
MKKEKFLTVFAVLDNKTQQYLKSLQNQILKLGHKGTQTMDIPFHISLGSFPVSDQNFLVDKVKKITTQIPKFEIKLNSVNHFSNKVLFIEPETNPDLLKLHNNFDNNYADGFPWHAHITIFCGPEENVCIAKEKLLETFKPCVGEITSVQIGEFFPTKLIKNCDLKNNHR